MSVDRTVIALAITSGVLLASAVFAPQSLVFLLALGLAKGLVVLGLVLLMRTGLVSFGQGLYYGLGAYAAALLANFGRISDAAVMLLAGTLRVRRSLQCSGCCLRAIARFSFRC